MAQLMSRTSLTKRMTCLLLPRSRVLWVESSDGDGTADCYGDVP